MPTAFREFQVKLHRQMQAEMADGRRIPFARSLEIKKLLGIAVDPLLQPKKIQFLQSIQTPAPPPAKGGTPAPATNKPVNLNTQPNVGMDAVEARKSA